MELEKLKNNRIPLRIQLLADGEEVIKPGDKKDAEVIENKEQKGDDKTYTNEELTEIVDKAVARTIARERTKMEEELAAKEKEKEEETELAKMSAEERAKALHEKERATFEKERAEFHREKLLGEAKDTLVDLELSRDFAPYLLAEDREKTLERINQFKEQFDTAVNKKVEDTFKASGRDIKDFNKGKAGTVNPFMPEHHNLTKQGELWKENPELAKSYQAAALAKK